MFKATLPFRQIHLDYHTSPEIPDLASEFDAEEFARRMKASHVNSVTLFAKCHHGVSYYPTKVGIVHPTLKIDLMGEMIEALHHHGIQAVPYISVARDEHAAALHQEWLSVLPSGVFSGKKLFDNEARWLEGIANAGGKELAGQQRWRELCMNNEYIEYVFTQAREVLENYDADGIWFDIIHQAPGGCICNNCVTSMRRQGLDPGSAEDRAVFSLEVGRSVIRRGSELVWSLAPEARVFFNSRVAVTQDHSRGSGPELPYNSHLEIESLPSGGWGYMHFPFHARYFAGHDVDVLGMTSRFHKAWGDCGSSRYEAALEYECLRMLAMGCKCSIGDQLNPGGRLEDYTYDRIGRIYRLVEEREPWCADAKLEAEIGVLITDRETTGYASHQAANEGAISILQQLKHQFHILDDGSDLSRYRVLVLPDTVALDDDLAGRVSLYLAGGGRLLLSHRSGLRTDREEFALDLGLEYCGPLAYSPDYLRFESGFRIALGSGMNYVMYEPGSKVALSGVGGSEAPQVLAGIVKPYFNRTWDRFCGQSQTPADRPTGDPGIVASGNVLYLAHPVFTSYALHAHEVELEIVRAALNRLLPDPLLRTDIPLTAEATVTRQNRRKIVHLLNYVPQRLSKKNDIVVASQLLAGTVSVRCEREPGSVYLAPGREQITWRWKDPYAECVIPVVNGHTLLVLEG